MTAIQWTHRPGTKGVTWNPATGCTKVSPGCAYCYIPRTPPFRMAGRRFVRGATGVLLHADRLEAPLRWRSPRTVFVNSLSDLFHEDIPDEFLDRIFAVMALSPQHTYQVLTKRPERMREYARSWRPFSTGIAGLGENEKLVSWPLPNVWLGVTAENQHFADERIPILLDTPAAVRFVSLEPLLGPIDLTLPGCDHISWYGDVCEGCGTEGHHEHSAETGFDYLVVDQTPLQRLDWVIAGGESGGPENRRLVIPTIATASISFRGRSTTVRGVDLEPKPHALEWARSLRDQCVSARVPFFFKQWGGPTAKSGGRLLDGRTWDEYPA